MNNPAKLIICGNKGDLLHYVLNEEEVEIGRKEQGDGAGLQISTSEVAEKHGKFFLKENVYYYQNDDNKETYYNDILIGSEEMEESQLVTLIDGDILRMCIGEEQYAIIFRSRYKEEGEWNATVLDSQKAPYYLSCKEEESGNEVRTGAEEVSALPERYGYLCEGESKWVVSNHNTRFGVHVNGKCITENTELHNLDVIRIGGTIYIVRDGNLLYNQREAFHDQLEIHIKERTVRNGFHKHALLKDINLAINSGEMVLILGGSGSGKTTFINAVMGYEKADGIIEKNGVDIYKNYESMKYQIGYVPQEDLLRLDDFVGETLKNSAELKLPRDVSEEEMDRKVDEVLTVLGLEREKESLVSKLSGGQRKRLSIALEYIADPSLFFLDEPDSGLDGVAARQLMENLRDIADEDKTVLIITHTPDRVIDLFDKVIVLAKGNEDNTGHLAFYGTPQEAGEFFEVDNMEGIVRRIDRVDEGGEGMADIYIEKYKRTEGV